jgi:hypothetical protein
MIRRILVTGSRDWTDRSAMALAISDYLGERGTSIGRAWPFPLVIHGGARGADACADAIARNWGWTPRKVEADWYGPCREPCRPGHRRRNQRGDWYCPAAGNYRNQAMVDSGADICLAFPLPGSEGTWDCVQRAKAAGIPVRVITPAMDRDEARTR